MESKDHGQLPFLEQRRDWFVFVLRIVSFPQFSIVIYWSASLSDHQVPGLPITVVFQSTKAHNSVCQVQPFPAPLYIYVITAVARTNGIHHGSSHSIGFRRVLCGRDVSMPRLGFVFLDVDFAFLFWSMSFGAVSKSNGLRLHKAC